MVGIRVIQTTSQEDIFGRVLRVVDSAIEARTTGLKKSIEELSRRADHQEVNP